MYARGDGLVAAAGINSVDDLKGKKVALDKSATSYYFFMQVLSDSNITEEDVEIVDMGNDESGEALLAGNVDAAVTWEPILSQCAGITFYDKAMNDAFADASGEENVFEVAKSMAAFWKEKGEMDAEEDDIKAFFPTMGL